MFFRLKSWDKDVPLRTDELLFWRLVELILTEPIARYVDRDFQPDGMPKMMDCWTVLSSHSSFGVRPILVRHPSGLVSEELYVLTWKIDPTFPWRSGAIWNWIPRARLSLEELATWTDRLGVDTTGMNLERLQLIVSWRA